MLIEVQQFEGSVILSYANKTGGIDVKKYPVAQYNGIGPFNYRLARYKEDPEIVQGLVHFKDDLPIKKVLSYQFDYDSLREFIVEVLPEEDRNEIFNLRMPGMYSCDIEINVGTGEIFPDPKLAAMPIDSIQITAPNLNTVVITCNQRCFNAGTPEGDAQIAEIEQAINDHYKDVPFVWEHTDRLRYSHIVYATEKDMLEQWWKLVFEKLHHTTFWNGDGFDVPYFWNRCAKLGIDIAAGSPVKEASNRSMWPRHRHNTDYMATVRDFAYDLHPKLSLSLNYIAERIFGEGKGKLHYEGGFAELFNGPIVRYMTYGAIDTIAMQLIHKMKNYSSGQEAVAFYTRIPISEVGKTTALVHAVIWDELWRAGKVNAEEYVRKEKHPYGGGYVKQPTRKFCMYPTGEDFSALYPRVIQSHNLSFENFVGVVKNDAHKAQLLKEGYMVTVDNNYYKNDKTYCLKAVQDKFLTERYAYKDLQMNIWNNVVPALQDELKRRGIDYSKL